MTHTFYVPPNKSAVAFFQIDTPDFLIGHTNIFQHIALRPDQAARTPYISDCSTPVSKVTADRRLRQVAVRARPTACSSRSRSRPRGRRGDRGGARVNARPDLDRWVPAITPPNHDWEVRTDPRCSLQALYKVTPFVGPR